MDDVLNLNGLRAVLDNLISELRGSRATLQVERTTPLVESLMSEIVDHLNFLSDSSHLTSFEGLERVLEWSKQAIQSRFRPLRVSVVQFVLQTVEYLFRLIGESPSDNGRQAVIAFCVKANSQFVSVCARDSSATIREMVAEYMCRWCVVYPPAYRLLSIEQLVEFFLIDDEYHVRVATLKGLRSIYARSRSGSMDMLSSQTVSIILKGSMKNVLEMIDLVETGNPPYVSRLNTEVTVSLDLIQLILDLNESRSSVLDELEELFDEVIKIIFLPAVSLSVKQPICVTISKHILGSDILTKTTGSSSNNNVLEILFVFIAQYVPFNCESTSLWRNGMASFASAMDRQQLSALLEQLMSPETLNSHMRASCESRKIFLVQSLHAILDVYESNRTSNSVNIAFTGETVVSFLETPYSDMLLEVLVRMLQLIPNCPCHSNGSAVLTALVSHLERILHQIDLHPQNQHTLYSSMYNIYRVWSLMGGSSQAIASALQLHTQHMQQHISVDCLTQVHALESALDKHSSLMSNATVCTLMDFIERGDIYCIGTLVCAVDLLVMQLLKCGFLGNEQLDVNQTLSLYYRLMTFLKKTLAETSNVVTTARSAERDTASSVHFYCKYRLALLEIKDTSKSKKFRGNIAVSDSVCNFDTRNPNSYIISTLIEKGIAQSKFVECLARE